MLPDVKARQRRKSPRIINAQGPDVKRRGRSEKGS
jgi:hypothetical protein